MIIPEKNRREICKSLFQEGVCYAEKDSILKSTRRLMFRTCKSSSCCKASNPRSMCERYLLGSTTYYWYLTNKEIEHLRTYLNLPSEIVPATLVNKTLARSMGGSNGDRRPRALPRSEGGSRSSSGEFGGVKAGAPAQFQPYFRGSGGRPGFGRGSGAFVAAQA